MAADAKDAVRTSTVVVAEWWRDIGAPQAKLARLGGSQFGYIAA